MLYSEIIAVCFQIHTKHINTLCGQNVELLNVKLVVHIVTTGLLLACLGDVLKLESPAAFISIVRAAYKLCHPTAATANRSLRLP